MQFENFFFFFLSCFIVGKLADNNGGRLEVCDISSSSKAAMSGFCVATRFAELTILLELGQGLVLDRA